MATGEASWNVELLAALRSFLDGELDDRGPLPVPREDLVGEALVRFLVASAKQPIRSPFSYARTILLNVIRDHIRKLQSWNKMIEAMVGGLRGANGDDVGRHADPEDAALDNRELVSYLLKNSTLSPIQEKVIHMIYFDGMSITEVANELSKNPGTILQHRDRGLEKLARCAEKLGVCR